MRGGSTTLQIAITIVCWVGICRPVRSNRTCSIPVNTLIFDHKFGSREERIGPFSYFNKVPLDPESGTLRYANAGHDLPYLRRVGGDAEELRARGMPLGLMPGMNYEQKEIVLEDGEAALFYSDGLVEAHDQRGEMFGFPRLRALVAEHGEDRSLEDFLMEELYSFVGEGWEQEDDITLLTLRRSRIRS